MQPEVTDIFERISDLQSAITRLQDRRETALDQINDLQKKLPSMLTEYATGQRTEADIDHLHLEILRLQQVANEPIKAATRQLDFEIKELQGSQVMSQYRADLKARNEHQQYLALFNKVVAGQKLPAQEEVYLTNIAPAYCKEEVKELCRQFSAFRRAKADNETARFEDFVNVSPTQQYQLTA